MSKRLLCGVSSTVENFEVFDTDAPLVLAVKEERKLDTVVADDKLEDDKEGNGSGIRTDSSLVPPRRATSAVQLFSFTMTGFDLCQHKLATA